MLTTKFNQAGHYAYLLTDFNNVISETLHKKTPPL